MRIVSRLIALSRSIQLNRQFREIQRSLYETPSWPPDDPAGNPDRELASSVIQAARSGARSGPCTYPVLRM